MEYQGAPRGGGGGGRGGGGRGGGGRGGGGFHHGGGGRRFFGGGGGSWGWRGYPYWYSYSPYDYYYPPYTYVAASPSDSDTAEHQALMSELTASQAKRQEQSRWLMYLVGLLIIIAVVGFLLVKQ